jgi:hypothetical protein
MVNTTATGVVASAGRVGVASSGGGGAAAPDLLPDDKDTTTLAAEVAVAAIATTIIIVTIGAFCRDRPTPRTIRALVCRDRDRAIARTHRAAVVARATTVAGEI